MARYTDVDKLLEKAEEIEWFNESTGYYDRINIVHKYDVETAPTADVAPRAEVFEEVDKFKADLMDKFIDLCRGNDYNKLTLLKIGDVVDEMYDRRIAELKKKYTEE